MLLRAATFALALSCSLGPARSALSAAEAIAEKLDGESLQGRIVALAPDHLRLIAAGGEPEAAAGIRLAFHELRALRFSPSGPGPIAPAPAERACLIFRRGELLPAKLLAVEEGIARALVRGPANEAAPAGEAFGELRVPLSALRGARLREEHAEDSLFEDALAGPSPTADVVYVRREGRLVPIEGVLRRLDEENVALEYRGRERRVKRNLLYGIQLAPVGSTGVAGATSGYEGLVCLRGGGRLPAAPAGLLEEAGKAPRLRLSVGGLEWQVELSQVEAIVFANERVVFLSDLEPVVVAETALLGAPFPHRRDQAVSGGPLRLAGIEYRKGLGLHARAALEYALEGDYESFAARVGLDDGVRGLAAEAAVAVLADGRRIFEAALRVGEAPLDVAVAVAGTRTLRLEVDFGADGLDSGDHVDWAEARLVKALRPAEGKPR